MESMAFDVKAQSAALSSVSLNERGWADLSSGFKYCCCFNGLLVEGREVIGFPDMFNVSNLNLYVLH